jgi:hypothetical protein
VYDGHHLLAFGHLKVRHSQASVPVFSRRGGVSPTGGRQGRRLSVWLMGVKRLQGAVHVR